MYYTKAKKDNILRKVLTIEDNPSLLSPAGWESSSITESVSKLRALAYADEQRKAKEAALNDLEAYIYKVFINQLSVLVDITYYVKCLIIR